jgi:very-short-patch-repair endonuclease
LDFYCVEARLSVELDGGGHGHPEHIKKDLKRSQILESLGIREVRFWNHFVKENIHAVIQTILRELNAATPHLDPLPFRRGEETRAATRKPLLKFTGPRNVPSE